MHRVQRDSDEQASVQSTSYYGHNLAMPHESNDKQPRQDGVAKQSFEDESDRFYHWCVMIEHHKAPLVTLAMRYIPHSRVRALYRGRIDVVGRR
jgi:hypothetical protein